MRHQRSTKRVGASQGNGKDEFESGRLPRVVSCDSPYVYYAKLMVGWGSTKRAFRVGVKLKGLKLHCP